MSKRIIVDYLREKGAPNIHNSNKYDRGKSWGVVVAVVNNNNYSLGFSICNKKDKWNRERGKEIAIARAEKYSFDLKEWNEVLMEEVKFLLEQQYLFEKRPHKDNFTLEKVLNGEFETHLKLGKVMKKLKRVDEIAEKVINKKS